jgi:hypothetical protein
MIAVLLAPPCVAAGRLDMAVSMGTNPYIRPCGRNDDRTDAPQLVGVPDFRTVRTAIGEPAAHLLAANARLTVADITQPYSPRRIS